MMRGIGRGSELHKWVLCRHCNIHTKYMLSGLVSNGFFCFSVFADDIFQGSYFLRCWGEVRRPCDRYKTIKRPTYRTLATYNSTQASSDAS